MDKLCLWRCFGKLSQWCVENFGRWLACLYKGSSFLLQWDVASESAMMGIICPLYICCWSIWRFRLSCIIDWFVQWSFVLPGFQLIWWARSCSIVEYNDFNLLQVVLSGFCLHCYLKKAYSVIPLSARYAYPCSQFGWCIHVGNCLHWLWVSIILAVVHCPFLAVLEPLIAYLPWLSHGVVAHKKAPHSAKLKFWNMCSSSCPFVMCSFDFVDVCIDDYVFMALSMVFCFVYSMHL